MGLERIIPLPAGTVLAWERICSSLREAGEVPVVRMIDGLPAFPDETPAEDWKELRLGLSGGMVTLRRTASEISCICWGTDDADLKRSFEKVIRACQFAAD